MWPQQKDRESVLESRKMDYYVASTATWALVPSLTSQVGTE